MKLFLEAEEPEYLCPLHRLTAQCPILRPLLLEELHKRIE
jgi:hypothetical protein